MIEPVAGLRGLCDLFVHICKALFGHLWFMQAWGGERNLREGRLRSQGLVPKRAESRSDVPGPSGHSFGL